MILLRCIMEDPTAYLHEIQRKFMEFASTIYNTGICPAKRRLLVRGTRHSAIPTMTVYGLQDVFLAEGTINGGRFAQFVEKCCTPCVVAIQWSEPLLPFTMWTKLLQRFKIQIGARLFLFTTLFSRP